MKNSLWFKRLVLSLLLSMVGGCGLMPKFDKVIPDKRTEYKKSRTLPDLEVPPDLTTDAIKDRMAIPRGGSTSTYSTYQERIAERKRQEELRRAQTQAIKVLENEHVLAVAGQLVQVWPQLREFLQAEGFTLELDDDDLGVMETEWVEDQENLTREKYKIFGEPGTEPGTSVLYIAQRQEELVPQGDGLEWQTQARDVARERVFVESLEANFQARESTYADRDVTVDSEQNYPEATDDDLSTRAELISAGQGKLYLSVSEDFSSAWQSTAIALDRLGLAIDHADKTRGVYFLRVPMTEDTREEKSMLAKLKFWGDDDEHELQLSLTGVGEKTELVVLDKDGRWETGPVAKRVINRLLGALNEQAI